ncbi:MAG: Gfo/Idh/MocA family oxidoreductase [Chloroflexi bacterium]|nr:Gfo/Idh/MocA family oxidoreductase [Chloroflexota bacterium]
MTLAPIRVGIVGLGQIARAAHLDACARAADVELAAICDRAPDLLADARRRYPDAVPYAEYDAMLGDPSVDAVIVATADQFHVALAARALGAGKHVFVEKPMGVAVEECEELRSRAVACGQVLQVGFMKRFDPAIQFGSDFIVRELGTILAMRAWYCDSTFRYTMTDNLQPPPLVSAAALRPDGDPKAKRSTYYLLAHGSHLVDTARYLAGEIEAVRARRLVHGDAHCWFVETRMASGALGHLELTVPLRGDFEEGFRIYGEHGSVFGRVYLPWFHRASEVECFSARDGVYRRPLGADAHTYRRQIEGFAGAICGSPGVGADADDGVANIRALTAIARSVESDGWVEVSAVTGGP